MNEHKGQSFIDGADIKAEDLGGRVTRSVLAYGDGLMLCRLHFEKGSIGAIHSHPHTQITYVLSGIFEFTVDGKKHTVKSGDSIYDRPDVEHGCVCIESGDILDIFSPMREEFV